MIRLLLSAVAVLSAFTAPLRAQTFPYDACGTLVPGVTCQVLFQDGTNPPWLLSSHTGFVLGDVVRVVGVADPGCITFCQQGGCINVTAINFCITNIGVPYCFGDGTATSCPCANASPVGSDSGCLHSGALGGKMRATG